MRKTHILYVFFFFFNYPSGANEFTSATCNESLDMNGFHNKEWQWLKKGERKSPLEAVTTRVEQSRAQQQQQPNVKRCKCQCDLIPALTMTEAICTKPPEEYEDDFEKDLDWLIGEEGRTEDQVNEA